MNQALSRVFVTTLALAALPAAQVSQPPIPVEPGVPVMVKDINPGPGDSVRIQRWVNFATLGKEVFFAADDGINGNELWKSDGTAAGTVMVKDINTSASLPYSSPDFFVRLGNITGTKKFMDLGTINGGTSSFVPVRSDLMYFTAVQSPASGGELWQSDGTPAGTYQIGELRPGIYSSDISAMTLASGEVLFFADDGVHGKELWKISPGATAQTLGSPCGTAGVNPRLSANEPMLGRLWSIQGQGFAAGTSLGLFASLETVPRLVQTCDLFVDPLTAVLVHSETLAQSTWTVTVPVPNVLALTGVSVALQAAQAPSAATLGIDLSNGLVGTFGG